MDRARQRKLRELNDRAWAGDADLLPLAPTLDSSLKKNTAFIKRLRTAITSTGQAAFLTEITSLSLHKYLSEIITACYEGLCKLKIPADIPAAVEVVSALHQRFGPDDFTTYLAWLIGRGMSSPDRAHLKALSPDLRDKEERDRLARHRILLRVLTDFWLVRVLRTLDDISRPEDGARKINQTKSLEAAAPDKPLPSSNHAEPFPLEVLKDLLGHDRDHVNLPLVVMFVKTFAFDLLGEGPSQSSERKTVDSNGVTAAAAAATNNHSPAGEEHPDALDTPLVPENTRQRFRNIFDRYFHDVSKHIVRDQAHLTAQKQRNAEIYVKVGEVFEDRHATFEKLVKAQDRLIANAQVLSSVLGLEMPSLDTIETNQSGVDGMVGLVKTDEYLRSQRDGAGLWDDDEERRFYENLIDVKQRVPSVLLEDKKKSAAANPAGTTNDHSTSEDANVPRGSATPAETGPGEDQSTVIVSKTIGAQVDAVLARLPEVNTKDQIDQCAIDFCFLNSKASRNRLIKALQDIPKARLDLLPLYARLVATLAGPLPDISSGIVAYLDDEFRSLQRRKTKDFLGPIRMVNVRYIAELTKFGTVPEHVIFHCLKVSLDDFSRMNIEIIASLLENCGRFLLRKPESSPRMTSFLQALNRKKGAQHLGQQEKMLLENAVYFVDPPERPSILQKERSPIELYIRNLIYIDLSKRTLEKVTKQLRKLHWEDPEVSDILRRVFGKPGKLKFGNMHLLAVSLGALHRYHQDFAIAVMDDLLERVYAGLDHNDFRQNQKRIADIRFLGELYVYRLIDSTIIMDTLYGILTYGHAGGYPRPGDACSSDLPDDYFRIRLVASLLETCGMFFDKGLARQKLDFFLAFYQYYIFTKDTPPMEVDFVVQDVYATLRPQWKLVSSLEAASEAFAAACKQKYESSLTAKEEEPETNDDQTVSDDAIEGAEMDERADENSSSEDETDAASDNDSADNDAAAETDNRWADEEEEEEQIIVIRPKEERDPEADAEFDRELAKLMSESVDSRKSEKRLLFDVPIPLRRTTDRAGSIVKSPDEASGVSEAPLEPVQTMTFSLLSKRGNKPQTRSVALPKDSSLAMEMQSQQQAERAEQQRIKELVLNYDMDNDDGSHDDSHSAPSQPRHETRSVSSRNKSGARRLQLSDVNW